jgi:hypothetical protein
MQTIRLPTLGAPRWPQFQHSLGSVFCWLPLICLLTPCLSCTTAIRGTHLPRIYKAENDRRRLIHSVTPGGESGPPSGPGDQRGPGFATRLGGAPGGRRPGLCRQVPEPCWARNWLLEEVWP